MSWYYAENNERRGPVEDVAFDALVSAGTIKPDTLVWQQGMDTWQPFATAGYRPTPIATVLPAAVAASTETTTTLGPDMGVCSESGRVLPRSELVEIDGKLVSAEYKNVVLQRIREGVGASGSSIDPEALGLEIAERGWEISAGSCLSRGWAIVKRNFWLATGATFLAYLCIGAASMIPLGSLVVQGPLMGGIYWLMLRLIRGEPSAVADAFQGFTRGWGQLVLASVVTSLLIIPCVLPGAITILVGFAQAKGAEPALGQMVVGGVLAFLGVLVAMYLVIGWMFAIPLIIDKRVEFWPAMKLSRKVVGMHWWQIFWLLFATALVLGAIMFAGMAVLGLAIFGAISMSQGDFAAVGISVAVLAGCAVAFLFFAILPIGFSTVAVAYEDIFGQRQPT